MQRVSNDVNRTKDSWEGHLETKFLQRKVGSGSSFICFCVRVVKGSVFYISPGVVCTR